MSEIGVFTPEQARTLWQDYLRRQQLDARMNANYPQRRLVEEVSPHRVFVSNVSGEEIPAYGCMEITGTADVGGRTTLTVDKPTTTTGEYVFNSQFAIATGAAGWAYRYGVVVMLGSYPPTVSGARYSAVAGSWLIEEGDGPFVVFGEHNAASNAVIGRITSESSGVQIIRFELVDRIDCATCQARARVLSRPPGVTRVADEDEYGLLLVYDLASGWLNRPDVDLVDPVSGSGARGYAARLDWDVDECAIDPLLTTKWEIISLLPLSTACP